MIGKFPVSLVFCESGTIRGKGGETVHGFVLNEVARVTQRYAETLHNMRGVKPFSLSPLLLKRNEGEWEFKDGKLNIRRNTPVMILISAFDDRILNVLMEAFTDADKQKREVKIGGLRAVVNKVGLNEMDGGRFDKFSDIMENAKMEKKITFYLLTPLSFRQNGIQQTFPTPELVFSSLLQTWNAFSDIKIPEEIKDRFRSIVVSRYNLHSELWHFSKYKIFGCRGRVEYTFKDDFSESELRILNALSRFATYSGIGYKRTMGMGMVDVRFG